MITRRDAFVATFAVFTTAAIAWSQSTSAPVMKSSAFTWEKMETQPTEYGATRQVFDARPATLDRLECHVTTLNPGQQVHPPHQHPEEALIIIKEGTVESLQGDEKKTIGPGAVVFEGSGELHNMKNVGESPATYYVIKWWSPLTDKR